MFGHCVTDWMLSRPPSPASAGPPLCPAHLWSQTAASTGRGCRGAACPSTGTAGSCDWKRGVDPTFSPWYCRDDTDSPGLSARTHATAARETLGLGKLRNGHFHFKHLLDGVVNKSKAICKYLIPGVLWAWSTTSGKIPADYDALTQQNAGSHCERRFSFASYIEKKSSLSSKNVSDHVCLSNWLGAEQ